MTNDELAIQERNTVLARCEQKLIEAIEAFANADRAYLNAASNRAVALGTLNEAQKAMDKVLETYRSSAPSESDWKSRRTAFSAAMPPAAVPFPSRR